MPYKLLTRHDTRAIVDVTFVCLVFSLSLIPFIPWKGWDGYAPGTFVYQDETYYVRYSDEKIGSDKPHIFLLEGWPVKSRVDVIEFSDIQTYVNGSNLYVDLESHGRLADDGLNIFYESNSGSLELVKSITVTDEGVTVRYESDQPIELRITFWRWHFSGVDDRDFRGMPLPLKVEPTETLNFEFTLGGTTYEGLLEFSSEPSNIEVWRDPTGLNKILIDYAGSNLSVRVHLREESRFSLKIASKDLIFPLISAVLGLLYLKVGRYAVLVKTRLNRTEH